MRKICRVAVVENRLFRKVSNSIKPDQSMSPLKTLLEFSVLEVSGQNDGSGSLFGVETVVVSTGFCAVSCVYHQSPVHDNHKCSHQQPFALTRNGQECSVWILTLAQRNDVLHALGMTRMSLRQTLKEAREIRCLALEEEVLTELERMNKICENALRDTAKAERFYKRIIA